MTAVHRIRFEDATKGTVQERPADEVPDTVAWVDGIAVVRVVAEDRGDERVLRSYGADGALLQSTVMRR